VEPVVTRSHLGLLCTILFLFAAGSTAFFAVRTRDGVNSNNWTETVGTVVNARRENVSGETYHQILVEYSYEVGSKKFIGSRISFRIFASGPVGIDHPERFQNQRIPVFYDPTNPNRAVLVRGAGVGNFFFLAVCAVLSGVLLSLALVAFGILRGHRSSGGLLIVQGSN
jgi:Protein of unknown function (DUF3592)